METNFALIGIIVQKYESAEKINSLLHDYRDYIIGRMGLPHRSRGISVISIVMEAPVETVNKLSDALSAIDGVSISTICSPVSK